MPPWRTPQVTLNALPIMDFHITEQLILLNQLCRIQMNIYGTFRFINFINSPLIKTLSNALLASKSTPKILLACLVKYFIDSTNVNCA